MSPQGLRRATTTGKTTMTEKKHPLPPAPRDVELKETAPPTGAVETPDNPTHYTAAYVDREHGYVLHDPTVSPFAWISTRDVEEVRR